MTRPYSEKFLLSLYSNASTNEGVVLAKLCVDAKLPAAYVAKTLGITRTTIHNWFRGGEIRRSRMPALHALIYMIQRDLASGVLPAKDTRAARRYLESVNGEAPPATSEAADTGVAIVS